MRVFRSFHTVTQSIGSKDLDRIERKARAMECHRSHIDRICMRVSTTTRT